jgi:4-amino-4-deoxy-L-arabinose transferase-like glycosyltransferase
MKQLASRLWNGKQAWLFDVCVLIVLGFFLFMLGNGNYTLFDNSETHYSRVAQEMVQSRDYLTLHFNGQPWYVHPPLYFWLTGGVCSLFGWTEFSLRFWEGFFGIAGLLLVYHFGTRFFNRKTGLLAAIVLASSLYYIIISRVAVFDMLLNFFIICSSFLFLQAYIQPEKKTALLSLAGLSTGLGILAKGPIALLHPGLVIVGFLLWKRDLKWLLSPAFFLALGISLIIGAPWYIYEILTQGEPFFRIALKDYTWYRFLGVVESQTGPWYFYVPVLAAFFPWILYLPGVVRQSASSTLWKNDTIHRSIMAFCWLFILITFMFFSLAKTKLPTYILSLFPFLSFLTAHYILHEHRSKKLFLTLSSSVGVIGFALWFCGRTIKLPPAFNTELYLVQAFLTILAISTAIFSYLMLRHKKLAAVGVMTTGMGIAIYMLTHIILPTYEHYKDVRLITDTLHRVETPYVLVNVNTFSPYMRYYLNRNIQDADTLEQGLTTLDNESKINPQARKFLVVNKGDVEKIRQQNPNASPVIVTLEKALVEL